MVLFGIEPSVLVAEANRVWICVEAGLIFVIHHKPHDVHG